MIFKSHVEKEFLYELEKFEETVNFIPILHSKDEFTKVEKQTHIHLVGAELLVKDLKDEIIFQEFMSYLNKYPFIVANAEDLGKNFNLFSKLTDTTALLEDPENSWGKMIDLGFSVIQTDFPKFLNEFRSNYVLKQ